MNKFKKILIALAWISCIVVSGVAVKSIAAKAQTDYQVTKIKDANMKTVVGDAKNIYNDPFSLKSKVVGNTNDLADQSVNVVAKATSRLQTYYQIKRAGKVIGWVESSSLKTPDEYVLPYTYISQLYPTYAPSGCEAASLQMALSTKGLATNVTYKKFLDGIPLNSDPNKGYNANPYKKGAVATIYPAALKKYAAKYGAKSADISGASESRLIKEIKKGNPVVFEGAFRMSKTNSTHVLVLLGYRDGQFLVADPYMSKDSKNKVFWVDTEQFMKIYNKRSKMALVVY